MKNGKKKKKKKKEREEEKEERRKKMLIEEIEKKIIEILSWIRATTTRIQLAVGRLPEGFSPVSILTVLNNANKSLQHSLASNQPFPKVVIVEASDQIRTGQERFQGSIVSRGPRGVKEKLPITYKIYTQKHRKKTLDPTRPRPYILRLTKNINLFFMLPQKSIFPLCLFGADFLGKGRAKGTRSK